MTKFKFVEKGLCIFLLFIFASTLVHAVDETARKGSSSHSNDDDGVGSNHIPAGAVLTAQSRCELLSGSFGYGVQVLLAVTSFSVLVVKYIMEQPRRPFAVYALDISKQIVGGLMMHGYNLLLAMMLLSSFERPAFAEADSCDWYWVSVVLDTTAGTLLAYRLLRKSEKLFEYSSGQYVLSKEEGISWKEYGRQLGVWIAVVAVVKVAMSLLTVAFQSPLYAATRLLLSPLDYHRRAKLVVVMVVTPLAMNALQFWLTDLFLRYAPSRNFVAATVASREADVEEGYKALDESSTNTNSGGGERAISLYNTL